MAAFGKRLIIFAILLILGMLMGMQIAGTGFSFEGQQQGQGAAVQQQLQQGQRQEQTVEANDYEQTVSASLPEAQPQIITRGMYLPLSLLKLLPSMSLPKKRQVCSSRYRRAESAGWYPFLTV